MIGDTGYHELLRAYPEITHPSGIHMEKKHDTVPHIRTTPVPPVAGSPRRLAPDKL